MGVSIVLIYGVYKIKLAMKKKKEARLAAQIKKAIGWLTSENLYSAPNISYSNLTRKAHLRIPTLTHVPISRPVYKYKLKIYILRLAILCIVSLSLSLSLSPSVQLYSLKVLYKVRFFALFIGLLKAQAEASNRNPQIPPYLLKSELRDKVLQGSKANKYFIHDLNLAVTNIMVLYVKSNYPV